MLAVAGAVPDPAWGDRVVAAHYGAPAREQRLLAAGQAVVEQPHGVVVVTGSDRRGWIDTLSSQRVRDLAPGESAELLLLDTNGRVAFAVAMIDDGARSYLITEGDRAGELAAFLQSMRFMLDVAVTEAEDVVVLGLVAPAGAETPLLETLTEHADVLGVWRDPWPGVAPGGTRYSLVGADDAAHPGHETPFALALVRADDVDALVAELGAAGIEPAGTLAWEALRIAAWRPRAGREVDDRTLPHELDWLRTAVHLTKGCYRGQEGVARTFNLGRPPRRLVFLHLDGSDHLLPEPGAPVALAGADAAARPVGHVTSVGRHHDLGPIALALVKRSVPGEAELLVAGPAEPIAAAQEVIVCLDGHGEGRPAARGPLARGLRQPTT